MFLNEFVSAVAFSDYPAGDVNISTTSYYLSKHSGNTFNRNSEEKINLKVMIWEPDADPGRGEWQKLKAQLIEHPAKWMLWEGEPLPDSADRLQAMGLNSTLFAPCFSRPEQGDFLTVMRQNVKNMEKIFE